MGLFKYCSRCKKEIVEYPKQYCERCAEIVEAQEKQRLEALQKNEAYRKASNKRRAMKNHDNKEQVFYASLSWRRLRKYMLSKCKGICLYCLLEKNEFREAKDVHHIVTLKEDWDKRLDVDNLVCLCRECHLYIHEVYRRDEVARIELQERLQEFLKEFKDKYNIDLDYYDEDDLTDEEEGEEDKKN